MRFEKKGNLRLYTFDNFEEYLDRAENPTWKIRTPVYASQWGSPEYATHVKHARMGWSEVTSNIDDYRDVVVSEISTQLPKPRLDFDKTGSFWDLSRVIEGDPDCWQTEMPSDEVMDSGKGNLVRIVINTASSYMVRSAYHTARCGAVLAICQLLEMMGFMVQFEITTAISVNHKKLEFRTIAKRPHEAFNVAALAFWCSKSMENHIDFAICETMEECLLRSKTETSPKVQPPVLRYNDTMPPQYNIHSQGIHYGAPIFTNDPGDICFDRGAEADVDWNNKDSARAYIVKMLNSQGVFLKSQAA